MMSRVGGILLHPTSLPGPDGIGDLGAAARDWVDWLGLAGCGWWQVLPLGPTGYGDSPYQSPSSHAGNPLLVSLGDLAQDGLLMEADLAARGQFPEDRVEFGRVIPHKRAYLDRAAERFAQGQTPSLEAEFRAYVAEQGDWLEDYAIFSAIKQQHGGAPWMVWEAGLAQRKPTALQKARLELRREIEAEKLYQFLFDRQWSRIRGICAARGVALVGDLPIFVSHDSVEVWANRKLFHLDSAGRPRVVAGVPPDLFAPEGQRWGNPLYRWEVLREDGFVWWTDRMRAALRRVDWVRLDHFLAFSAYWEIPADSPNAVRGRWVPGPGAELLSAMSQALGSLPVLAEDLGVITPEVITLRDQFHLPGMKILQFAFGGGGDHPFLPHNYPAHCVVYTGTHDNDTALGWYTHAPERERDRARRYLAVDGRDFAWDLIRSAWGSVAEFAVAPMQDVLGLNSEARMNLPGKPDGNWTWRVRASQLEDSVAARLRELNDLVGRSLEPRPIGA